MAESPVPLSDNARVAADVRLQRPPLGMDLVRMAIKIAVGGVLFTLVGLLAVGAVMGAAAGFGGEFDTEETGQNVTLAGDKASSNEILSVDIRGIILTHEPRSSGGFFLSSPSGVAYGYSVKEKLLDAAENDTVKAVLLHVRTPGGSVAGSQAIADGVEAVKAAGKPIVAYVDGISASGGVWATAGVDAIFLDHGSIIGSVGVLGPSILEYVDPVALGGIFSGVETRGGINLYVSSAGSGKDLGNPFRPMTDDEKIVLQALVEELYDGFVTHVVENRGVDREALVNAVGAGVLANEAAMVFGFSDGTKSYQESIAYLAEAAQLGEDYRLIQRDTGGGNLFGLGVDALQTARIGAMDGERPPAVIAGCQELRSGVIAMAPLHFSRICGF